MNVSVDFIRKMDRLEPGFRDVFYSFIEELEKHREERVSKIEFNELKEIVRDLARGNDLEVNIFGMGEKEGKEVPIIGECKSQLSKNDVDTFLRKKVKRLDSIYPEPFLVLATYMTSGRDVEEYVKKKGIALYHSYRF